MEPAEFILKIIIVATLCFGILGMIVESSQFEGVISVQNSERLAMDVARAAYASPCLTAKENGEGRSGLLDERMLDNYNYESACLQLSAPWSVVVSNGTAEWKFGGTVSGTGHSKVLPVAIRRHDGTVVLGTLTAKVGEVG